MWLGRVLNSHQDVKCTTGQVFGHDFPYDIFEDYSTNKTTFDFTQKLQKLYTEHFGPMKMLKNSASLTNKKFVGDMHGYDPASLIMSEDRFGPFPDDVRIVGVVRHPVTWLNAWYSLYRKPDETSEHLLHFQVNYIAAGMQFIKLFPELNIDEGDGEVVSWLGVAIAFMKLISFEMHWLQNKGVSVFKIEELMSDRRVMADLFSSISGGAISESSIDFDSIYNSESVVFGQFSKGKTSTLSDDAYKVYYSWPVQTRRIFGTICEVMGVWRVSDLYKYDMSFVERDKNLDTSSFAAKLVELCPPLVRDGLPPLLQNSSQQILTMAFARAQQGALDSRDLVALTERLIQVEKPQLAADLCNIWLGHTQNTDDKHVAFCQLAKCQEGMGDFISAIYSLYKSLEANYTYSEARQLLVRCSSKIAINE